MAIEFIVFLVVVVPAFWAAPYALAGSERMARLMTKCCEAN